MSGLNPIILIKISGFIGPEGKLVNPNDNSGLNRIATCTQKQKKPSMMKAFWCSDNFLLYFLLHTSRVTQNVEHRRWRRLQLHFIECFFAGFELSILCLQFAIAEQRPINLLRFLLRGLVVKQADQVVLGKSLYHRQYFFWSFSFSS